MLTVVHLQIVEPPEDYYAVYVKDSPSFNPDAVWVSRWESTVEGAVQAYYDELKRFPGAEGANDVVRKDRINLITYYPPENTTLRTYRKGNLVFKCD